jgi:hypothetical protein
MSEEKIKKKVKKAVEEAKEKLPPGYLKRHPILGTLGSGSLATNIMFGSGINAIQNFKKIEEDQPITGKYGGLGPIATSILGGLLSIPAGLLTWEGYKALKRHFYPDVETGFNNMIKDFPELKDEIDKDKLKKYYIAFHALSPQLAAHPAVAASFVRATAAAGGGIDPGFAKSILESEPDIAANLISNAFSYKPMSTIYDITTKKPTRNKQINTRQLAKSLHKMMKTDYFKTQSKNSEKKSSKYDIRVMEAKMKRAQKEYQKLLKSRIHKSPVEVISERLERINKPHSLATRILNKLRGL